MNSTTMLQLGKGGVQKTDYCVYDNWHNSTAVVHKIKCSSARKPGVRATTGEWLGPFADRESALNRAKATRRRDLKFCGTCLPGLNNIRIEIAGPDRQHWAGMYVLVDTGAFISSVPASVLRGLGVAPSGKRRVRFGQSDVREMDYAQIWLRFGGQEIMTFALFNDQWARPTLGAYALAGLFIAVDPVAQRLVPIEEIHV